MQKRHPAAVRARHRRLIDQSKSLPLQALEMRFEIRHAKADVMNALSAFFDELRDRRFRRERLEQLESRVADFDERSFHSLRRHVLHVIDGESESRVNARGVDGTNGDADVIESRFAHQTPRASAPQMCLCSCVCSRAGMRSASIHSANDRKSIYPHTGESS